ncbi:MAG: sugar nucleotide-binding protein [Bacteroidota bacterium]
MKKILVTGASSYVGARLYDDFKNRYSVKGTYLKNQFYSDLIKLDMRDKYQVEKVVVEQSPDVIVHVAANAGAAWCEKNKEAAIEINQKSVGYFCDTANKVGAKLIFISSFAAINHKTVYAETKRGAEKIIEQKSNDYLIIRPAHIVGYSPNTKNDRQFNRFLNNITETTPAVYDSSWKFQPTYLKHISELINEAIKKKLTGLTINVAVPELKTRFDLAKDILSPFEIDVTSKNANDNTPSFNEDLSELSKLDLPEYSYEEMINDIHKELKKLGYL